MVVYTYLSFPVSSTPSVLIGTANIPYVSTDGVNRSIQMTVPIGFSFSIGNLSVTNAMTITVTVNPVTLANVYKNGALVGTTNIFSTPNNMSTTTTKQFVLGSGVLGACSLNSYLGNIVFSYTPILLPAFNTTDVYSFYVPFSYTITSTSSTQITSTGTNNINYGIISNTTLSTSSFNQMSYYTGSTDTTGYTAYNLWTPLAISSNWGVSNQGYVPTTNYSLWTGFYQMATLYANSAYFTTGISFKNVGSTNTIAWLDSDANGGGTIANWYASLSTLAMSFVVNSKLTNGFIFTGGNVSMSNNLTVSGNVTMPSSPTLSYSTLPTLTSGQIGYTMSSSHSTGTISTNTNLTVCSLLLPAGVWLLTGAIYITGTGTFSVSIATSPTGDVSQGYTNYFNNSGYNLISLTYVATVSSPTTYYLSLYTGNATSLQNNFLKATRIA